jgi:hypothetical protein
MSAEPMNLTIRLPPSTTLENLSHLKNSYPDLTIINDIIPPQKMSHQQIEYIARWLQIPFVDFVSKLRGNGTNTIELLRQADMFLGVLDPSNISQITFGDWIYPYSGIPQFYIPLSNRVKIRVFDPAEEVNVIYRLFVGNDMKYELRDKYNDYRDNINGLVYVDCDIVDPLKFSK